MSSKRYKKLPEKTLELQPEKNRKTIIDSQTKLYNKI